MNERPNERYAVRVIAGCDPGRSGSIAFLYANGSAVIHDMPTLEESGEVDGDLLLALFNGEAPDLIIHERLWGPDHFKIGDAYGALRVAALASRCRVESVPVATWQAEMHQGFETDNTKKSSIAAALALFPSANLIPHGKRVPKHDRCEALLIAEYGRRHYSTKGP